MEDGELTMTVSTHQQNIKQCLAAFRKLVSGSGGEEEVRVGCCYSPDTTKVELCLTIPCSSSGHMSCFPQNLIKITLAKPRQEFKSHCCPLMQTSHGFKKVFTNPNWFFREDKHAILNRGVEVLFIYLSEIWIAMVSPGAERRWHTSPGQDVEEAWPGCGRTQQTPWHQLQWGSDDGDLTNLHLHRRSCPAEHSGHFWAMIIVPWQS